MVLLSPKIDYAFKKIFGNENKPEILIGFLNAILETPEHDKIVSVELKNPNNDKNYKEEKYSILDVKAETSRNDYVNIEIQVAPDKTMVHRLLFYWSRIFSSQPKPGKGSYNQLKNTIAIVIMDYCLEELQGEEFHSIYRLMESKSKNTLTKALELHFIELEKFKPKFKNEKDFWLEFINNPESVAVNKEKENNPSLESACEELNRLSLNDQERELYGARQKAIWDEESRLAGALEMGREEGRAEGEIKGRAEGEIKGRAEGEIKGRAEGEIKGREAEKLDLIRKAVQDGKSKALIFEFLQCTEEQYAQALEQAE